MGFALGAVVTVGVAMLIAQGGPDDRKQSDSSHSSPGVAGRRTVAQLTALSDAELARVDIVEMSVAVAREIPSLAKLDYGH